MSPIVAILSCSFLGPAPNSRTDSRCGIKTRDTGIVFVRWPRDGKDIVKCWTCPRVNSQHSERRRRRSRKGIEHQRSKPQQSSTIRCCASSRDSCSRNC
ncbi:hypothetical protein PUN28_002044 [Cardiocondyla obscurior]|uniref:Secreted protein n=1 Tax=Cardiocondyla obscurior TaxID=286306 RepID=A0AAW2GSI7_9HYME